MIQHANRLIFVASLFTTIFIVTGCDNNSYGGNESIQSFAINVLSAARNADVSGLVEDLTFYSDLDYECISQQTSKPNSSQPKSDELLRKDLAQKDVELWLNSYANLFTYHAVRTSRKKFPSATGAEVSSMIIWVENGDKFMGILIGYLAKICGQFKVIQWVSLDGREAYYGVRKKRAILVANDESERKYPRDGIKYQTEMHYDANARTSKE